MLIKAVFGEIRWKGPGVFIAGGAGITPFVAILRQLRKAGRLAGNTLIFSNKTWADIPLERELRHYLGAQCIFTLTREKRAGYENGPIDERFLRENLAKRAERASCSSRSTTDLRKVGHFYVCGPPQFVEDINGILLRLGARQDKLVYEG